MAVEEGELLLAVGGIRGRVQIDGDAPGAPVQPLPVLGDHQLGQAVAQPHQVPRATAFSNRDRVACVASGPR